MFRNLGRKVTTAATIVSVGGIGLGWYYKNPEASLHEYVLMPLGRALLDGEQAHRAAVKLLAFPALAPSQSRSWDDKHDPKGQLRTVLFKNAKNPKVRQVEIRNPIGCAAGFDKNGEAIDGLYGLGFGYVEVGSVTPLAQPGNPRPRVFRLEKDEAVINRYGFNSDGHAAVLARLKQRLAQHGVYNYGTHGTGSLIPGRALAVNLGKNKNGDEVQDYVAGIKAFGPYADVLVVNVSSPNTPGLRDLQKEEKLTELLETVVSTRDGLDLPILPPVVVKIAPDLSEQEIKSVATAVSSAAVDGVIVSNTTIQRPKSLKSGPPLATEVGGLSGRPVKPFSLAALKTLRKYLGPNITIIGCGGISNGADALEFAQAGADAVQLYTSFAFKGFGVPSMVKKQLIAQLGDKNWSDAVNRG
jgi:dihydroorotate dehydrogenase